MSLSGGQIRPNAAKTSLLLDKRECMAPFSCLLESFPLGEVEAAVREALRLGAIGFDAIKHLVLCRIERRPPRLDLDVYPYLPKAHVETTSAKAYMSLIGGARP